MAPTLHKNINKFIKPGHVARMERTTIRAKVRSENLKGKNGLSGVSGEMVTKQRRHRAESCGSVQVMVASSSQQANEALNSIKRRDYLAGLSNY